jgi:uncharacterized glyoxalase superfamily protein PhnB
VSWGNPPRPVRGSQYFGYFLVDNVDEYFKEVKDKGADFTSAIADKPWNMREFGVRTPDGFRIMFGQQISSGAT